MREYGKIRGTEKEEVRGGGYSEVVVYMGEEPPLYM
jgi:hypothetical protein